MSAKKKSTEPTPQPPEPKATPLTDAEIAARLLEENAALNLSLAEQEGRANTLAARVTAAIAMLTERDNLLVMARGEILQLRAMIQQNQKGTP